MYLYIYIYTDGERERERERERKRDRGTCTQLLEALRPGPGERVSANWMIVCNTDIA